MEEKFVTSLLSTEAEEANYPGDITTSGNWPGVAPGSVGMDNVISPKYCSLSAFATLFAGKEKPQVLWVRGAEDQIVSDTSLLDFGFLGQLGLVPGWPGTEVCRPRPMVSQMPLLLDAYTDNGGRYREELIEDCGLSPHIEKPEEFERLLTAALRGEAACSGFRSALEFRDIEVPLEVLVSQVFKGPVLFHLGENLVHAPDELVISLKDDAELLVCRVLPDDNGVFHLEVAEVNGRCEVGDEGVYPATLEGRAGLLGGLVDADFPLR